MPLVTIMNVGICLRIWKAELCLVSGALAIFSFGEKAQPTVTVLNGEKREILVT